MVWNNSKNYLNKNILKKIEIRNISLSSYKQSNLSFSFFYVLQIRQDSFAYQTPEYRISFRIRIGIGRPTIDLEGKYSEIIHLRFRQTIGNRIHYLHFSETINTIIFGLTFGIQQDQKQEMPHQHIISHIQRDLHQLSSIQMAHLSLILQPEHSLGFILQIQHLGVEVLMVSGGRVDI